METAVRWSYGEATLDEVRAASASASAAAAYAAAAAAYASAAASASASERERVLAECADLAREHVPLREVLVALAGGPR
jgi:acyl-CoA reductase-like NAD-dependent aldehyde dehydrogenase